MSNSETPKCPICGEITSSYMGNYRKDGLCKKHALAFKNGTLAKDKNDEWIFVHEWNKDKAKKQDESTKKIFTTLPRYGFSKCVICGVNSMGNAFCNDCYYKHTKDELLDILNSSSVDGQKDVEESESEADETNETDNTQQNKSVVIDFGNKSKCITCGRETGGLLFCSSCYHKYKNKELLFKITKCTDIELLDEDYEGKIVCKDGHVVKSKSERFIDNYLFEHGITHAYERGLSYGAKSSDVLHPDFYLPNYLGDGKDVYIEHWGYEDNNINYIKSKKFKISKYKELGVTLVCTHEKTDMKEIDVVLDRKLNKKNIKQNEINFEND